MANRFIKKLTQAMRKGAVDTSAKKKAPRNASRNSPQSGSELSRHRRDDACGKSDDGSGGEVWRPGQKRSSRRGKKQSIDENSGRANQKSRRRKPRKRRPAQPQQDEGVLSQPDEKSAASSPVAKVPQKKWTLDDYPVSPAEGKTRFHDVDLPLDIMHGVADLGFEYCTPIQARVLQEAAEGHNVAGQAQTGTGKTAAFLLLAFKQFLSNPSSQKRPMGRPRALVIAPTRELVIQIVRDANAISKYAPLSNVAVYGGADYEKQERELMRKPVDLVAATPGRLLDFKRKRRIDLSQVEILVIDEADRMLDMGFIPDVRKIIRSTPPKDRRRTLLFSATLSDDVMRLASQWMPNPHVVEIEPEQVAVDTVKQLVYMVSTREKFKVLYNLLKHPSIGRVLIFANRRDQTDRIAGELKRYGVHCELLSGAVNQKRRMRVIDDFQSGRIKTVVATDVAGRGLHVDDIDHVINFDLPYEAEDYVHRIGRTGRAGAEGTAVSFACEDESFTIPEIESFIGEDLACRYPEDVLLKPLPKTNAKPYRRRPRSSQGRSRSGGNRRGGSRRPRSRGPRRR